MRIDTSSFMRIGKGSRVLRSSSSSLTNGANDGACSDCLVMRELRPPPARPDSFAAAAGAAAGGLVVAAAAAPPRPSDPT